jgi:uncharacterized protein (DUF1697 family)
MAQFLAFLRGINVGGRKLIKMNELCEIFESIGLSNVQTYIQSGNVSFNCPGKNIQQLKKRIEIQLLKKLGYNVPVILRQFSELENMVAQNPFLGYSNKKQTKLYVCFLEKPPGGQPKLPLINAKEGLKLLKILHSDAFLFSHKVNGRFGFPNNFIEKELGVVSTARNWNTILKIIFLNNKKK